jgi:ketosteroid isomerase-like protein
VTDATSMANPTVARGIALYATLVEGDDEKLGQLVTDDAQIHWPGSGQSVLGGTHSGRQEVMAVIALCNEVTEGTLQGEILDILADDTHVVIINRVTGRRSDGRELDVVYAGCFVFNEDGKADQLWWLPNDMQAEIDFLA